jgi:O-antigen/teichoic acid export membrane protein
MIGSTLSLSASRIFGAAISGVQAIYIARALGPEKFGVFNLIYLIGWYVGLVHFGARDVAFRDIPYFRGQKDPVREKLSRDVSLTSEILWRALTSSGLVIAAFMLKDPVLRYGLVLWAVSMFLTRMAELYYTMSMVEQDFVLVSWVSSTRLAIILVFVLMSIRWLGVYGPVLAPALGSAVAILLYARRHPLAFSFSLDRRQFGRMVTVGVPLAALTLVYWLYQNADRSIIAAVLSKSELGYYAIAAFIVQFLSQLPADFIAVLQPNLYRELGKGNRLADIKGLIVHTTRAYAYLSPLAILVLWTWFPPLVHLLLPKYESSIPVLRILSLTIFFSSVLVVPYTILYSPGINRQILCVGVWGGSALLTAGSGYGLLRLGYGLSGVAVCSVLGQAVAAAAFLFLTRRYYCEWMDQKWHFYLEMLAPIGYASSILGLLGYFALHASSIPALLGESALLLVAYAPWLLLFNRKAGLVKWKPFRGLVNGSQA